MQWNLRMRAAERGIWKSVELRRLLSAAGAGTDTSTLSGVGVLLPPGDASQTEPLVSATGAPCQAVQTRVGAGITPGVAADTQASGVVVLPRTALQTRWRDDRTARPAREAEAHPLHRDRIRATHAAAGEAAPLSSRRGHRGDYAGGRLRLRPSRGVTFDVAGLEDGWSSPLLILTASGRRAAVLRQL